MPHKFRPQPDGVDADQIARMGGRRHRERSVNSELARRLRGFNGRPRKNRFAGSSTRGMRQRVVIKAHVSRHKPGTARLSLARHLSYLARQSASLDGKHGVFYDAAAEGVDARRQTVQWALDRHHFRLIVSPERGGDIPDMTAYVRQVMSRVQRDLDSPLSWIAVNHHNTDNPHAHILLRGKRPDGTDLVIPRQYISYGICRRASEVATELLGERSAQEVQLVKSKEVQAERFTSLDRMIERHLENGCIDVSVSKRFGFGVDDRRLVVGRLQFLEQMDLAHKGRGTTWHVQENFKPALRQFGKRNDIIHQLYSQLGNEAGRVAQMTGGAEPSAPVVGIVIAKGSVDEIGEDRFIVLREGTGQAHYGRVRDSWAYRDLNVGSVAELGAATQQRRQISKQIAMVARANHGIYSARLHEAQLRGVDLDLSDLEIGSRVRSAVWRLGFWAGLAGSGVRGLGGEQYAVNADAFAQFSQRDGGRTDLRVITEHPLAQQIQANAVTWLDHQAFGHSPDRRTADHPIVQEALRQREQWLVGNGYARRWTDKGGSVELVPGALKYLAAQERTDMAARLGRKYGLPVNVLPQGAMTSGKYQGTEHLQSGKLAVVVGETSVNVSPVRKTPDLSAGSDVHVRRMVANDTTIEGISAQVLDLESGLTLDGTGGER